MIQVFDIAFRPTDEQVDRLAALSIEAGQQEMEL